MTVVETLSQLVGFDSVSSRSNIEIANFLNSRCECLGLSVKRFSYIDDDGVEKQNLIAMAGAQFSANTRVELALVGHTDTVPYDPAWKEALTLVEREGKLFARGACDTKAFIAAALTAVERLNLKKITKPLALIFTSDEEIGLRGAKRLADVRPLEVRYSIVGEPTSLQPIRAGKGYSLAQITVRGREAHSAYPSYGVSAILRATHLLGHIEKIAKELEDDQHIAFDPPYTTLNVGVIQGGTAKNVVPGECRLVLEWRPIPGQDSQHLLSLLTSAIEAEQRIDPDFKCEIDAARADSGFETSPDSPLVRLLEEATQKRAGTVAFGTEAAQMNRLGAEAVVLGPGDIRVAHRTGEYVPVDELERCVHILEQAIGKLCY